MQTMGVLLVALVALPAAAAGQRAGLLLATAGDSMVWIAARGDTVSVRRGPGLLVPRRDGFWRLTWLSAVCPSQVVELAAGSGTMGAVGLTGAPLGRRPAQPELTHPAVCHPEYMAEGDENVRDSVAPRFVGTDHVVLAYHYANEGATAQTRLYVDAGIVLALDDLGRQGFALDDRAREAAAPLTRDVQDSLFTLCEAAAADRGEAPIGSGRVLGLRRTAGRWAYDLEVHNSGYDVTACPLDAPPPREVVGFDSLAVSWDRIVARVPRALDAFTSPRGDLAVVRDSTGLQVFRAAAGALGDQLGSVPLQPAEEIVLAQWSLGASVARWDRILSPLLPAFSCLAPRGVGACPPG